MKTYLLVTVCLIGIASFIAEFGFLSHASHGHWWDHIPGFYAIFGLLGSLAMILISQGLGNRFIQKEEDYYDDK